MFIRVVALMVCSALAGCQSQPSAPWSAVFDAKEHEKYERQGTSSISGQAFLRTRGGDVKLGAGRSICLNPATSYSKEWFDRVVVGGENPPQAPNGGPGVWKYTKVAIADGDGRFEFSNIPDGDYYITCVITWEVPSRIAPQTTGGIAYSAVSIGPGQSAKVIVTR